jgi:hypothetical protein
MISQSSQATTSPFRLTDEGGTGIFAG